MRISLPTLLLILIGGTAVPEPPTELVGIAHVAFRVSDVSRSREFYRKLGFEQAFEFADPGKPPVSYMKVNDRQFIELYGRADDSQPLGMMHICYEAEDIETLVSEYTKRGLNPPPPRKARAGNLLFVIRDPEDQIIEYTQYLPGSMHFEDRGQHLGERRISQHVIGAGVLVRDLESERSFYTSKLAFETTNDDRDATSLRIPGRAFEEILLERQTPTAKSEVIFGVPDHKQTSKELSARGIAVQDHKDAITVGDPDGVVVIFKTEKTHAHAKP